MKAFPIYRVEGVFEAPIPVGEENRHRMRYMALYDRPGWYQQRWSGLRMFHRPLLDRHQCEARLATMFAATHHHHPGAELLEASLTYVRHDTWALGWFNHFRIDTGESDEEVLDSFADYVSRVQVHNERMLRRIPWPDRRSYHSNDNHPDAIQLMGAEDRWRWCGTKEGAQGMLGVMEDSTDPPCRCDGCQSNGLVRICH